MPETSDPDYVVVQNLSHTVAVFSGLGRDYLVTWGSPRQHDGTDVQRVPKVVAQHPSFRRAVMRGIFAITTDEALEEANQRQIDYDRTKDSIEAQAQRALQPPQPQIIIDTASIDAGVTATAQGRTSIESLLGASPSGS